MLRDRPHRALVALLLVLSTIAALAAIEVRWLDAQLLDSRGWTQTSNRLIENRAVRSALAEYAVDRALGAARIDRSISGVLPGPLAADAERALHRASIGEADTLFASRPGRGAWRRASRQAQADLLTAAAEPHRRQSVVLDLSPLLHDVVGAMAGSAAARAVPGGSQLLAVHSPDAGRLIVLRPGQLRALRVGVSTVRALDWALPVIALCLYALALILGDGWRAIVLTRIGVSLIVAGGVALILRAALGYPLSAVLAGSAGDRAAVRAAWLIGTSDARPLAVAVLVAGVVVAVVGWLGRLVGNTSRRQLVSSGRL